MEPALFIRSKTVIATPPLVPEIRLYLATEVTPIWYATESSLARSGLPPPYWAFAWAGGQALARYLLDHPETVRGRAVEDVATGSGVAAIAAALAGAATVSVTDVDPEAVAAAHRNAAANHVTLSDDEPDPGVILAGD